MRMVLFGLAAAVPLALAAIPAQAQDSQVASAEIAYAVCRPHARE